MVRRDCRLRTTLVRGLIGVVLAAGLLPLSIDGAAPLAANSPSLAPQVKLVSILPAVIGPTQSTTVTWNADKKGSYSVRVGGSDCSHGTQVASGSYNTAPNSVATKIGVGSLAEGINTVRVCVTAASKTGSATGSVTRDTTAPTLSGTLVSSDTVQTSAYPGESVSVRVNASEPLNKLVVTCASASVSMSPTDSQHWSGALGVTTATPLGPLQCSAVGTDAAGDSNSPAAITGVSILPSPPTVTLSSEPDATTTSADAGFAWTTSGTVSATTCSLDGNNTGCTSPQTYGNLTVGSHTFTVTVSNAGGKASATYTWAILPMAPTVSISSEPGATTTATDATFTWTTNGTVTATTCTMDGDTTNCASPDTYGNLSVGSHTFTVTVSNEAGSGSATYDWTVAAPPPGACTASAPSGYTLSFCDDFDGPAGSAPDASKWNVYGGTNPSRWGVGCFVDDPKHIDLDGNGNLVETATYNPDGVPCTNGSGPYESGGMDTGKFPAPLFSFLYGEVEARIKVPCQSGYGMWPAWWMTGATWPQGGEVDLLEIMSTTGYGGYDASQHLHGAKSGGGTWSLPQQNVSSTLWCNDFHVYGAQWSPGQFAFLVDGIVRATFTPADMQSGWIWPFDSNPQKLFLDLQIGGAGGTIDNTTLPQSMRVDYVRVYTLS